jgi:hypothetical protein
MLETLSWLDIDSAYGIKRSKICRALFQFQNRVNRIGSLPVLFY